MALRERKRGSGIAAGAVLCLLSLALCVLYQRAGYLAYLDGDIAAEILLAHRQAQTGRALLLDWMYSTEIRILSPNLLYALAFLFDVSYETARIVGNTLGLALLMASCALLLRQCGLGWGAALAAAAALPLTAGTVYGYAMTVGGFYIFHCIFGMLAALLWLRACGRGSRGATLAYALLCAAEAFLSVRYVLCYICPAMAVALLSVLTARDTPSALGGERRRVLLTTGAGFAACLLGYAASEVIIPRLFHSGVGAADTFHFGTLSAEALGTQLWRILIDLLRLMGWQNGARLFSPAGAVNLCIAATLVLGTLLLVRACRAAHGQEETGRRMILLALGAAGVNLFSFLFIEGTYINRYLIPALVLLLPAVAVAAARERNRLLSGTFALVLAVQLLTAQGLLLSRAPQDAARMEAEQAELMEAAAYLTDEGYTHGYGTYWNVRLLEERTEGKLSFATMMPMDNEEGAVCPVSPELMRWMEPYDAALMDACPGKTFVLLSREEEERLAQWLRWTGAPLLFENGGYCVYGFESSQAFFSDMLLGKAKLENARWEDGGLTLGEGGRARVPTSWLEAGAYEVELTCDAGEGGVLRAYKDSDFRMIEECPLAQGENRMRFSLPQEDKYFMLLLKNEGGDVLRVHGLTLRKLEQSR